MRKGLNPQGTPLRTRRFNIIVVVLVAESLIAGAVAFILLEPSLTSSESPPETATPRKTFVVDSLFNFSIELPKTEFQIGENITVRFSLTNIGNQTIHASWPDSFYYWEGDPPMLFDLVVMAENGSRVFMWSEHLATLCVTYETEVHPEEEMVLTNFWSQKIWSWDSETGFPTSVQAQAGRYYIKGVVPPGGDYVSLEVDHVNFLRLETPALEITIG